MWWIVIFIKFNKVAECMYASQELHLMFTSRIKGVISVHGVVAVKKWSYFSILDAVNLLGCLHTVYTLFTDWCGKQKTSCE